MFGKLREGSIEILNFIIKSCGLKIQEYIMKSKNNNKL